MYPFGDFPDSLVGKESACNVGDLGLIPGLGRSPGEGKGYPFQDSGLKNSMICGVHGVPNSQTGLSDFHFGGLVWLMGKSPCVRARGKYIWKFSSVTQSCSTLCDPMDCTAHGILQARILEWVAFPFSRGSSQARNRTGVSCTAGRFFTG